MLVTGGAGYIGGHMAGMLLEAGYRVVVFDNLSTGVRQWIARGARFVKGDLCRPGDIEKVFRQYPVRAVMHFAARIVVPESLRSPVLYYRHNVGGTLNLLQAMADHKVRRIVFSSTAAVYGSPRHVPLTETAATMPQSPYGASKLMAEAILQDTARAGSLDHVILRYFNVAGWDARRSWPSDGRPEATHLFSNVMKALRGRGRLTVCGRDYPTPDGTGVRDFIHVEDLCRAHLLSLKAFDRGIRNEIFNLGTGKGFSVMDVIRAAEKVAGKRVPYASGRRRPGDVGMIVASFVKAEKVLGWRPQHSLADILTSEWERGNASV